MTTQQILNNIANPAMKWLLRSPLHGFVSKRVLLLEFVGRKSGKQYQTPTMYGRTAGGVVISTSRDYVWWRNLQDGAAVHVWLRGRKQSGSASTSTDDADIHATLRVVYPNASDAMFQQMLARELVAITVELKE
jgi:deazaflavin-dependent oxidoreductase (nitroreductase family)